MCFVLLAAHQARAAVTVEKDPATSDIILANEQVRLRVPYGHSRYGHFPEGYTGFEFEVKDNGQWKQVAASPFLTAYSFRSGWGRDWLHYVVPKTFEFEQDQGQASVKFIEAHGDLDLGTWDFEISFSLREGCSSVEMTYQIRAQQDRPLVLFWGPRFHVTGQSDEALFPGVEYLEQGERSSHLKAMAPDLQLNYAPQPTRVTIPLMAIRTGGRVTGMWWRPNPDGAAVEAMPHPVFASPNWLEDQPGNHLMGLLLPGGDQAIAENGMRAHVPVQLKKDEKAIIRASIFSIPGQQVTEAVDYYLGQAGGLPEPAPAPRDQDDLIDWLTACVMKTWDASAPGWSWSWGEKASPNAIVAAWMLAALPHLQDQALATQVRQAVDQVAPYAQHYLPIALRYGGLAKAVSVNQALGAQELSTQLPDGGWAFKTEPLGEEGLAGMHGPPSPGAIGFDGERSQGITAGHLNALLGWVLISGDEAAWAAAHKGLQDLNRYRCPYTYDQQECPQSPSLHGSNMGIQCNLKAYQISGDAQYLQQAVYWAKTGLPFVYLWSKPPAQVEQGQIHPPIRFVPGSDFFEQTLRRPMLYGALYGYGSSQYMHHWYGLLVHWVGLQYARDLSELAPLDHGLDWPKLIEGLISSGLWQTYDKDPYAGFYPDSFAIERWMPSGVAISPLDMLKTVLHCRRGVSETQTQIVQGGGRRYHVTAVAFSEPVTWEDGQLNFKLDQAGWEYVRATVGGLTEADVTSVMVDGQALPKTGDLSSVQEGWTIGAGNVLLLKVRQTAQPRQLTLVPSNQARTAGLFH